MRLGRRIAHLTALSALLWASAAAAATTVDFHDPLRSGQWYLDAMNFPQAWGLIYDQPQRAVIKSAVLDSGFDRDHEDLRGNTSQGYNVVTGEKAVFVAHAHGTATVGLMAASSGNDAGITRAAFTASVLPVQITTREDGAAFTGAMIDAIIYAVDRGARVINLSYTGVESYGIANAALYAKRHGAVLFMAAGNDGKLHDTWKNHNWVVAVGSIDSDRRVSSFSSRGSFVDFVAPGRSILTTSPGDEYTRWSGTSFASPLAASVASLMLTANPNLSSGQVIRILRATAVDLGPDGVDPDSGYGLIDAEAAVRLALQTEGKWSQTKLTRQIKWTSTALSDLQGLELSTALLQPLAPVSIPEPASALLVLAPIAMLLRRRGPWRPVTTRA